MVTGTVSKADCTEKYRVRFLSSPQTVAHNIKEVEKPKMSDDSVKRMGG